MNIKTIIFATKNIGKVKEVLEILKDLNLNIKTLADYPEIRDIVEDGETFETNALIKAREVFQKTGIATLSDDSGLEVFALDMKPGVFSARYAGKDVNYLKNNKKLLVELKSVPVNNRQARFRCVTVFKTSNAEIITEGICEGSIITEQKGSGGFGYDPLFVPKGYNQTFAELPQNVKNLISHRATALHKIKPAIMNYLKN